MNFIINKEQYLAIKAQWSATSNNHTAEDHIIYNVLRGFDPKRGFSPITDQNKLSNGASAWQSFETAKANAEHRLRDIVQYKHTDAERAARYQQNYDERIAALGKYYGIELTPELRATLREAILK